MTEDFQRMTGVGGRDEAVLNAMVVFMMSPLAERLPEFLREHNLESPPRAFLSGWRSGYEAALGDLESGNLQVDRIEGTN